MSTAEQQARWRAKKRAAAVSEAQPDAVAAFLGLVVARPERDAASIRIALSAQELLDRRTEVPDVVKQYRVACSLYRFQMVYATPGDRGVRTERIAADLAIITERLRDGSATSQDLRTGLLLSSRLVNRTSTIDTRAMDILIANALTGRGQEPPPDVLGEVFDDDDIDDMEPVL